MRGNTRLFATSLLVSGGLIALIASCGDPVDDSQGERISQAVEPEPIAGNPTCGEFNSSWTELKLDQSELTDKTYTSPDGFLEFTVANYDGQSFDWTSNVGVDAVFVKGGPGGNLYEYNPEALGDSGLDAHWKPGKNFGISHISICYDPEWARISIAPDAVNEVGDSHTFTVSLEEKIGYSGSWEPAVGDVVTVGLTGSAGAVPSTSSDTCATGTNASGECTVTFTSQTPGTVTGYASSDVDVDGAIVHVETDGIDENSGAAIKRFVDASITIAPDAVNEVGDSHTFIVTVVVDPGTGSSGPPPIGTNVAVNLTSTYGATPGNIVDTCATIGTDAAGQCSVMFDSATTGTVTASASVDVTVGGILLTRSTDGTGSNSGPAVKRFVDAWIQIEPDDTNDVGDYHTFTVTALQNDGTGLAAQPVPAGTPITVTLTDSNGAAATDVSDGCAAPGTDASGQCTVSFRSDSAGLITGHAAMSLNIDGVILARQTDGVAPNSDDAVKRYVDAWIQIEPDATNGVGELHTFTVTAMQNDGNGAFAPVPDGTSITVTLTPGGGASVADLTDNCGSTSGGTCTVTFTSPTAGTITAHASMSITVSGLLITRETDGIAPNSDDAVKTFVDGTLRWLKIDGDTLLALGGATFQVCRTQSWNTSTATFTPLASPECQTVVDVVGAPGPTGDQDPDPGEFQLSGLTLGAYAIVETVAPANYVIDPTPQTTFVTTTSPSVQAGFPFVNQPEEQPSGCTPGFWKNHTDLWDEPSDAIATEAGFTTSTPFNAYFGLTPAQSGFADTATMEDAINAGGGGAAKLARHSVAALLNVASGHPYQYSNDLNALKLEIQQAFIDGIYEPLATDLDDANNFGCLVQ